MADARRTPLIVFKAKGPEPSKGGERRHVPAPGRKGTAHARVHHNGTPREGRRAPRCLRAPGRRV
jgi:hypothetical protein